ncbi:hypothetical protein ACSSS7_002291 [Eimeria intestinalis]
MDTEANSPPFFPWKLVIKAGDADTRELSSSENDQQLERLGWSRADDGEWLAHLASGWLCNPSEKVFFHAEKNVLIAADIPEYLKGDAAEAEAGAASSRGRQPEGEGDDHLDPLVQGYDDDRLPLGVVAGSTEGLCYFTAIYDGHAGSEQLYRTVQRRREEELQKQGGGKRRKPQATQWLQQLNQSTHPLRPEERRLSIEMEALVRSCFSAFSLTDKNYLGLSEHALTQDGDSRAVLCRDGQALRLTEDHKPNAACEQKRIEAAGGQVMASDGIFEVLSDEEVVNLILSRLPSTPQEASQLVVDEAIARGGTDDKTCTVIYFKWRKDLFPPKSEEAAAEGAGQSDTREGEDEQRTQRTETSIAETYETPEKQIQEPGGAGGMSESGGGVGKAEVDGGQKDLIVENKNENGCEGGDLPSIQKEKAGQVRGHTDAAAETVEAEGGNDEESQNTADGDDADIDTGSKRVRSSGLEEIAAISTGLDVEALIRKRKREMQKEAEEAAAAAAAAAEAAEEDFDIFGGAPAASPKENEID